MFYNRHFAEHLVCVLWVFNNTSVRKWRQKSKFYVFKEQRRCLHLLKWIHMVKRLSESLCHVESLCKCCVWQSQPFIWEEWKWRDNIYIYAFCRRSYPKWNALHCTLSEHAFPGNRTHCSTVWAARMHIGFIIDKVIALN